MSSGSGFKVLNGGGNGKGKAGGWQGGACMLDSVIDAIVDAQGSKVNGEAVEIFGEMVVGVEVEAE